ncbi:MAG: hypothetical protein ACO1SV_21315 [Fimbriimonas sp.]
MITRLLTLALAATGLSVGGFQLGARQTSAPPTVDLTVPTDLPAGHALSVALQEPNSRVSMTDKERLRYLALEMESAKKAEADARVRILREKIMDLERQIKVKQVRKDLYEIRTGDKVVRFRTPKAKPKEKAKATPGKGSPKAKAAPTVVRYVAFPKGSYGTQLEKAERARARRSVELRYEDIAIQSLPSQVRTRVQAEARGLRAEDGERGFALLIALRERAALNLTPQQVTKLQLLQADFLRRFAPLREESETGIKWSSPDSANVEMWNYPAPSKKGEYSVIVLEAAKDGSIHLKKKHTLSGNGKETPDKTVKPSFVFKGKPAEKTQGDAEVIYLFEAKPAPTVDLKVVPTPGKPATAKSAKGEAITFRVVLATPGDVEKRIESLKAEIDDKVYEVLNDDQGKRLRRMVALSLSPQP